MTELLIKALLAYLLGNVLGGSLMARLRGLDLRRSGSGNVGATNALRAGGWAMALPVLLIDVVKGVLAVSLIPLLPWPGESTVATVHIALVCGVAVSLGHCYPFWAGFAGGKGVATLAGVFVTLLPGAFALMLGGFLLTVFATGYVALGSVIAAVLAVVHVGLLSSAGLLSATGAFVLAMATLVIFTHRENLLRLWQGKEVRMEKLALFRKWLKP
jgi:glycerol-3-phosphate acyltransferase PlsY